MRPDAHLSEELGRQLEAFADEQGIHTDHAYELLVSVGLEVLDGVDLSVSADDGQLVLECERCAAIFDSTQAYLDHEEETH